MRLPTIFFFLLSLILSPAFSQKAYVAPIQKDHSTLLYTLTLYLKTPLQPTILHLDLGASFTWADCYTNYNSTSYRHVPCASPLCNSFHSLACGNCYASPGPACANDTCSLYPENPVTRQVTVANAIVDSLALPVAGGSVPGQFGVVPDFVFSCSRTFLLKGLAPKATGLVALGRSNHSLPVQVSEALSAPRYFALCLSGSSKPGVALFGSSGPYYFSSQVDLSKSLVYTPLILNRVGNTVVTYQQPSDEYYINLTSIQVNGKAVEFNNSQTLLTVDENGFGGTKISTANPYTTLESSIYKAFIEAFIKESGALNLTERLAVEPFDVCYPASDVIITRVGPGVPTVDLIMQNDGVFWRIFGSNSMVRMGKDGVDVWCLGFVDGGANARTSVVIGGHQMEDNLLQLDLENQRLGFSSSILLKGTTCDSFSFESY
ncbi:hypothetical protein K2173_003046 [Erythroxylum novogranatense]|uniref:Peptidase A1 domain-containing protein n=1 Tax=Erythroxylum novogranatense TaxID=1862640 RepID=A0AAV8S8M5_9ROSI|nr:hypothetical protein K2173_003046 [Erythroxylum novogranatense]